MRTAFLAAILIAIPAIASASGKLPVPSEAALKEAKKLIGDVYKADYETAKTAAQMSALAKKMLDVGIETRNDATGQFALFEVARDIAAGVGDVDTAFHVIDEMGKAFEVDSLGLKGTTLTKAVRVLDQQGLAPRINELIDEAIRTDHYDLAEGFAELGVTSARKARNGELVKKASDRVKEVVAIEKEYQSVKEALVVLDKNPTDPEANLIVGKFRCFTKGDWDSGMPMLALGSDEKLKEIAVKELVDDQDALAFGDAWWSLSENDAKNAEQMRARAVYWYHSALPSLSGLAKARVKKRVDEVQSSVVKPAPSIRMSKDEQLMRLLISRPWIRTDLDGKRSFVYVFHKDGTCAGTTEAGSVSNLTAWEVKDGILVMQGGTAAFRGFFDSRTGQFLVKGDKNRLQWHLE